jgi:hypothetical protein
MPISRPTSPTSLSSYSSSSSSSITTLILGTDIDGEDRFIDSPPRSPSASESSTSTSSEQSPPTNPPLPLTLHTGPNTLIHEPLSEYLHGNISFNSFRAQVLAIRDEHLASLAPNSDTSADESSQRIADAEQQWWDTLEEVEDVKPSKMRLEGKILKGEVKELREQIRRLTGTETQVAQTVEDWVDEVSDATGGQVEEGYEVVMVDDYEDMHEVPSWERRLEFMRSEWSRLAHLDPYTPRFRWTPRFPVVSDVDEEGSGSDAQSGDLRDERSQWLD